VAFTSVVVTRQAENLYLPTPARSCWLPQTSFLRLAAHRYLCARARARTHFRARAYLPECRHKRQRGGVTAGMSARFSRSARVQSLSHYRHRAGKNLYVAIPKPPLRQRMFASPLGRTKQRWQEENNNDLSSGPSIDVSLVSPPYLCVWRATRCTWRGIKLAGGLSNALRRDDAFACVAATTRIAL